MEYTYLTVAVMAGSLAAAWWQGALRDRALWLALALFGLATVVVDVILTAIPVYAYADEFRSGLDLHRHAARGRRLRARAGVPLDRALAGARGSRVTPRRAVVVGAGLGGLAAALRLRALGLEVTVVERAAAPGGRAGRHRRRRLHLGHRAEPAHDAVAAARAARRSPAATSTRS